MTPSVSKQLRKYRVLTGQAAQRQMPDTGCKVQWQHPNTKDYFRNLMKEWRENGAPDVAIETRV